MNAVTQSEFARMLGVGRSYVTALKKADRLVLNAIGNVQVEESRQRILATADPNRDDVVKRWAAQRGPSAVNPENSQKSAVSPAPETAGDTHDYQKARAQKEHYFAEQARIDYERAIGKLVERSAVESAIEDVMTIVRQSIEQFKSRLPAELANRDFEACRAVIAQASNDVLSDMEREFTKRLNQMGSEE